MATCHSCLLLPLIPPPSPSSPSPVPPLRSSSLCPQPRHPSLSSTRAVPFTTAATLRTGHKRHVTTTPHARHPPTLRLATTHDHDSPQHIGIEGGGRRGTRPRPQVSPRLRRCHHPALTRSAWASRPPPPLQPGGNDSGWRMNPAPPPVVVAPSHAPFLAAAAAHHVHGPRAPHHQCAAVLTHQRGCPPHVDAHKRRPG
ncbi:hypothetical protein HYPSUDRAFT_204390 [Hypholoma sublateritium FD-334 SS-4]|uniref:Uncharacterized protein n=1 Tax=Hypholoma sublateritium (strain FD-334 SS-4) TaxID=945553 RepID=A0A0D2NLC6_HYPSF|nr:hypothetical protein HYPSUDRAFT_204390 [Hypholoma sublateritium FD-334 SS-4]